MSFNFNTAQSYKTFFGVIHPNTSGNSGSLRSFWRKLRQYCH